MDEITGSKKVKRQEVGNSRKYFILILLFSMLVSSFSYLSASVSIVSTASSKGTTCYVAGQNLTITINAVNPTAWANLHVLVIGSADAVFDKSPDGSDNGDQCLLGTATTPSYSSWVSTLQIATGGSAGSSVTGYQLVVPVPASYTTGGTGSKTFFVAVDNTSSILTIGQYYSTGYDVASVTLPECSLDTPTFTPTFTPTVPHVCNTGSAMYGATAVACINIINATPTFTPSYTDTSTRTYTPTFTATPTYTSTYTMTDTATYTPTYTMTYTMTATPTFTNTVSSDTPTDTSTYTPTFTMTPTFTNTSSPTATPSYTPTDTETDTFTATPTYTMTYTVTNTLSPTFTPTYTMTFTATSTYTVTDTVTNTLSPTFTPTYTMTYTMTYTVTDTPTYTVTDTFTQTNTPTPTFTATPTDTPSPTITPTPPPFPYVLTIGVYNEAGELVKTIVSTATEEMLGDIDLLINGQPANGAMTSDNPLQILLPGVQTPSTPAGQSDTSYYWNSSTNANQQAASGVYYIKFEQTDGYGHTNVVIKQINVLNVSQYAEVDIYNSAGEKVKDIIIYKDISATQLTLKVPNVIPVDSTGNTVTIIYGNGLSDYVNWNGLTDQGNLVQSGTYEVQVNLVTNQGKITVASKTVEILTKSGKFSGDVEIWPNPYVGAKTVAKQVKFVWVPGSTMGTMSVNVYNITGELVRQFTADMQAGVVVWDLTANDGSDAAEGLYVVIFQIKDNLGSTTIKTLKMTIQSKK